MKKYLIILITVMLILFSGCSSNTDGAKQSGLFGSSIGGGSSQKSGNGVTLEFAEGQPGTEYNKGQPFNFGFIFKNYQNHEISDMVIKISGIEWGYVSGLEDFKSSASVGNIPKATAQSGPGVYTSLYKTNIVIDKFTNKYNFNPKFDYCYTAKTQYREQICVPSKTTNSCNIKVDSNTYQNGPLTIKINNLRNYDANTLIVDLQISDSLSGKIVNECFKTEDYANEYIVNSVTLGGTEGDCSKTTDRKIVGNSAVLTCTFPRGDGNDDAYPSQLLVELEYKYQQSIQKNILIKDYTAQTN